MRWLPLVTLLLCASPLASNARDAGSGGAAAQPHVAGIVAADLDRSVRPQDDFYGFAVGGWIARVQGPAYMSGWSANRELQLGVYEALDKDVQRLAKTPDADPDHRKLADIYASYMDLARIDAAGLQPLASYFEQFDAATAPRDIVRAIATLSARGLDIGIGTWVHADDEDPTRYLADFVQSDLGLPDRDYYLGTDAHAAGIRDAYRLHVERVLSLSGTKDSASLAQAIVSLETRMAQAQWTQVATRVPGATSHRHTRAQLATASPGLDLAQFADGIGIPKAIDRFNVGEPSYITAYGALLTEVPVPVWRAYLRQRLIDHLARFLPEPYREEADRFFSKTLYGATASRPRWLRAMGVLEDAMGDALGQLYVRYHFSAEAKARATSVLDNVIAAFRRRMESSDWLSEPSKRGALSKLDHLVIRMGAPDRIRDYSSLVTRPTDAVGNWLRARTLLVQREIDKLGRPVDREEWTMSAQSVNGYYSVSRNQVVLPAALLQPPYFQSGADDAVNYGGLGFFIAHELTHAFDRAGSEYDGFGKRVEWMTPPDRAEFERRAHALIAQYGRYEVAPGRHVNGELTIGENIADNSGLAIAYEAWRRASNDRPAPVLDGLSGDQRFFLGFARIWAAEPIKKPADVAQALTDTHAPDPFRVAGAVTNQDAFQRAFDVREGDKMFVPPAERTHIW